MTQRMLSVRSGSPSPHVTINLYQEGTAPDGTVPIGRYHFQTSSL